ncbi:hypothetical protein BN982_03921 [Halobacillus karajensis]|nr:hypothetical protein BN982_03921 [Halobacillus karajensis]
MDMKTHPNSFYNGVFFMGIGMPRKLTGNR